VHLSTALALGNFLPQIRQPNIGAVTRNQILFSVSAGATAFHARQAHQLGGVVVEVQ
jgi:hypothetical protein